jgi:hypothetical protein
VAEIGIVVVADDRHRQARVCPPENRESRHAELGGESRPAQQSLRASRLLLTA